MDTIKKIFSAFLVGGFIGLLGEILVLIWSQFIENPGLMIPIVLLTLGLLGAIFFYTGHYQKLDEFGDMGAKLPFSGLTAALSMFFIEAKTKSGKTKDGVLAACKLIAIVVGIGSLGCFITALIMQFIL